VCHTASICSTKTTAGATTKHMNMNSCGLDGQAGRLIGRPERRRWRQGDWPPVTPSQCAPDSQEALVTGLQPCLQQGNNSDVESHQKQCYYVERSRSSGMASCHLAPVHDLMHEVMQVGRQTPLPTSFSFEQNFHQFSYLVSGRKHTPAPSSC
jgi:hypothetical protein